MPNKHKSNNTKKDALTKKIVSRSKIQLKPLNEVWRKIGMAKYNEICETYLKGKDK